MPMAGESKISATTRAKLAKKSQGKLVEAKEQLGALSMTFAQLRQEATALRSEAKTAVGGDLNSC